MMTNENITLESLSKELNDVKCELVLVNIFINNYLGRKLKGDKLKEAVRILTENDYSIAETSVILKRSPTTISNKRAEIKADDEMVDF